MYTFQIPDGVWDGQPCTSTLQLDLIRNTMRLEIKDFVTGAIKSTLNGTALLEDDGTTVLCKSAPGQPRLYIDIATPAVRIAEQLYRLRTTSLWYQGVSDG